MSQQTPVALAATAAEAVRQLSHRTLNGGDGWTRPDDVAAVLGSLILVATDLHHVAAQTGEFLVNMADRGELASAGSLDQEVNGAKFALNEARRHARAMQLALIRAQSANSGLTRQD